MSRRHRDLAEGVLLLVAALVLWVGVLVWRAEMQGQHLPLFGEPIAHRTHHKPYLSHDLLEGMASSLYS